MDSSVAQGLSTLDQWSLLVGVGLPALVAVINRQSWTGALRLLVSAVATVLASAVTTYLAGEFDTENLIGSLILVAFAAYSSYTWAWKPSGVARKIETSVNSGKVVNGTFR